MNLKKNHEKDKTKNRINPCSQETRERININYFKKDKMTTKENYTPQVYDVLYYLSDDDGNEMLDENGNVKLFTNPSGHIGGDCDLAEGIEAEDLEEINNKINQQ